MDQDSGSNQNLTQHHLCRSGCGFYGNSSFEGMCSKCYKDSVQRRNQNPSPIQIQGRSTPSVSSALANSLTNLPESVQASIVAALPAHCVETATPTIPTVTPPQDKEEAAAAEKDATSASSSETTLTGEEGENNDEKDKKPPKKSRCHICKKKVGLTGFMCRCGGLYCGLHRYSDKHECTFDYKELAQQQIRKANPVIVGEKINKI